jgi:hypothetical protein
MPIPPELIVFAVQSIVKLGQATEMAYEQWIRRRPGIDESSG